MALEFEKVQVIPEKQISVRPPSADTLQLIEAIRHMKIGEIFKLRGCARRTYLVKTSAAVLKHEGSRIVLHSAVRQGDLYIKRVA